LLSKATVRDAAWVDTLLRLGKAVPVFGAAGIAAAARIRRLLDAVGVCRLFSGPRNATMIGVLGKLQLLYVIPQPRPYTIPLMRALKNILIGLGVLF
jgi:hypothetical protein